MITILGIIGNIGILSGMYFLSRKTQFGWYLNILGCSAYLIQAILSQNLPLIFLEGCLIILSGKGIIQWKKI